MFSGEEEQVSAVLEFEARSAHPGGSDLIYCAPSNAESAPEVMINNVKEWLVANGKPGFKES